MRATKFNHVSIPARDLRESRDFYVDVLGMEPIPSPVFRHPTDEAKHANLFLDRSST